jgi:hypothetical protein
MIIAYNRSMKATKNMAIVQADFDRIALHSSRDSDERWNHNTHYHRFLLDHVPAGCTSDLFVNLAAIPANVFMQRLKNGHRPPVSPEARAAMAERLAHDSYLTLAQVHHLAQAILPGAQVRRHLFWRYSLVWKKVP